MQKEVKLLRPGEKEFLERFEKEKHFEEIREKEVSKEKAEEKIRKYIEELSKEIEEIPAIKKEVEAYPASLEGVSNILAQAVNLSLTEGILSGINLIKKTGNLHLIDAFHDLLAGHFFQLLIKHNKIKLVK
jgi:cell fate (sporulation/competence/biofilm development) regulator YmcA (YheA/YmcA/DUF963 family)